MKHRLIIAATVIVSCLFYQPHALAEFVLKPMGDIAKRYADASWCETGTSANNATEKLTKGGYIELDQKLAWLLQDSQNASEIAQLLNENGSLINTSRNERYRDLAVQMAGRAKQYQEYANTVRSTIDTKVFTGDFPAVSISKMRDYTAATLAEVNAMRDQFAIESKPVTTSAQKEILASRSEFTALKNKVDALPSSIQEEVKKLNLMSSTFKVEVRETRVAVPAPADVTLDKGQNPEATATFDDSNPKVTVQQAQGEPQPTVTVQNPSDAHSMVIIQTPTSQSAMEAIDNLGRRVTTGFEASAVQSKTEFNSLNDSLKESLKQSYELAEATRRLEAGQKNLAELALALGTPQYHFIRMTNVETNGTWGQRLSMTEAERLSDFVRHVDGVMNNLRLSGYDVKLIWILTPSIDNAGPEEQNLKFASARSELAEQELRKAMEVQSYELNRRSSISGVNSPTNVLAQADAKWHADRGAEVHVQWTVTKTVIQQPVAQQ